MRAKRAFVAGVPVVAGLVAAAFALADAPGPTLPAPKRGILERSMHPPAGGGGQPARKGRGAHEPPFAVPREPAHAGGIGTPAVLGGVPVPAPAAAFEVTNMSIDRRGTTYLNVYAGSLPPDHDRGALLVTRVNAVTGADLPGAGLFAAPAAVGPLRLSRVDAEVASFSYSGGTGTFDLATGQFTLGR